MRCYGKSLKNDKSVRETDILFVDLLTYSTLLIENWDARNTCTFLDPNRACYRTLEWFGTPANSPGILQCSHELIGKNDYAELYHKSYGRIWHCGNCKDPSLLVSTTNPIQTNSASRYDNMSWLDFLSTKDSWTIKSPWSAYARRDKTRHFSLKQEAQFSETRSTFPCSIFSFKWIKEDTTTDSLCKDESNVSNHTTLEFSWYHRISEKNS